MSRQASLTYRNADGRDERVELDPRAETSIGRHPACTITVNQPSVSRKHARIYFQAGGFYVEDLKSSNGTYINNQRIEQASLAEGDELRCGDFALAFTMLAGPSHTREVPTAAEAPTPPPARPSIRPVGHLSRVGRTSNKPVRPTSLPTGRDKRPPPTPAEPAVDEAAQARLAQADSEAARLAARVAELEARLHEVEADNRDKDARIAGLEHTGVLNQEQIRTFSAQSHTLRSELDTQQRQLEEYRVERAELEVTLAELRQQNDQLRRNEELTERDRAEIADQINDLKREVGQRDKQIRQLEQQQSVLEYDLRAAREENDDLRLALGEDDTERKDLNTTLDHLRQVVAEKEAMIEQLSADVRRLEDKLAQAEHAAREDAGTRTVRLREALSKAEAERDLLVDKLATLERQGGQPRARNAAQEIDQLKRANRELRQSLEDAQGSGDWASQRDDLEAHLALARSQARDADQRARAAEQRLAEGSMASPPNGADQRYRSLRSAAFELYDSLNDLANDLRMNVEAAAGLAAELDTVRTLIDGLPLDQLPADQAKRTRAAIDDVDLAFTLEDIGQALTGAEQGAGQFRKTMRRLRAIVDEHGYGS